MNKLNRTAKISIPVFDRLTVDFSRQSSSEQYISLNELYEIIRRDLEQLLNTRKSLIAWSEHYHHLDQSVLSYGIPDFTALHATEKSQLQLCQQIQAAIVQHEPRLQQVSVNMRDDAEQIDRVLQLRIEATINLQPKPTAAVFESCFDVISQTFTVT